MNRTYIKRQLTLSKLGIPMNKNIQEYVDYFNEIIGDLNSLKKEHGTLHGLYDGYSYSRDGIILLFYDPESELFAVNSKVWEKFYINFGLNDNEVEKILNTLLEENFKCKVSIAYDSSYIKEDLDNKRKY